MSYNNLVLVADDNQDLVETTCELLRIFGVNAQPCVGGSAAISLAQELRPEVVILDIGMPAPDGFATFSIIRSLHGCSTIPIVAVTAYSDPDRSQRIRDIGFAAHFIKPVNIELLVATVKKLAELEVSKAWDCAGRFDALSAQRLEVALVYKEMLGLDEATKYLESFAMSPTLINRVLDSPNHRT